MLRHDSAAMTLDVYADLFDSYPASVAETVAKMWQRLGYRAFDARKRHLAAHTGVSVI